jgi:hypothetical protein
MIGGGGIFIFINCSSQPATRYGHQREQFGAIMRYSGRETSGQAS